MSYKIIVDSCGELTGEMKESGHYLTASLSMHVNGTDIADDDTFDQARFLKLVSESPSVSQVFLPVAGGVHGIVCLRGRQNICGNTLLGTQRILQQCGTGTQALRRRVWRKTDLCV